MVKIGAGVHPQRNVGEFISNDRGRFVVATKYTLGNPSGDPNAGGNHRKNLVQSLEASLKRLKTDYVDLYWVHAWDEFTPAEETMRALDDVVRAGKVLYVGISDAPAWVVARANTIAQERSQTPFNAIQVQYSLIERTAERELLPMAKALGLSVTAWAPIGGGVLTGKYQKENRNKDRPARFSDNPMASIFVNDRTRKIASAVQKVAKESGMSPAQVALSWVRSQGGLIIPIIGARRLSQIEDNLGCVSLELSKEHQQRLDEISHVEPGFPHDFLSMPFIRDMVYAGMYDSIIDHRK